MEMEECESTDSGSLSASHDSDSPRLSGASNYVGTGAVGGTNMDKSGTVMSSSGGVGAINSGDAVVLGGGVGSLDLTMGKKKRGRPRKYDANGNLNPSYIKSPPPPQPPGFTLSSPPSYGVSSGPKRGRGKHSGGASWQPLASLGELLGNTAGGDFTPHILNVEAGEDVAGSILTFAQKGHRGICVISANGSVSNVTLRQPGTSGGLLTYEGRFEILTLTGSYIVSDNGGIKSRAGGLSVSLASADGRVIGGGVAGLLMAATPIQMVVGSFLPNGFKAQKRKYQYHGESRTTNCATPTTVTPAMPISQAAPQANTYPIAAPQPVNNNKNDWNGPRPSPDINISAPVEDM